MITDEELTRRLSEISEFCLANTYAMEHDKALDKIINLVKDATRIQLLSRDPHILIACILKILFYYDNLLYTKKFWPWKYRKKFKNVQNCYHTLLQSYLPEKSEEVVKTIMKTIYEDRLWQFESLCFEMMCSLLDIKSDNNSILNLIIDFIWDKLTSPEIDVEEARGILRLLQELLDIYEWPMTKETVTTIEKILHLFQASIINMQSKLNSSPLSSSLVQLKKSLELCLRNTIKHISNDNLLIIVHRICYWLVAMDMTDEITLEFGNILEYAAYMYHTDLYEETLTPTIFPLLMQMIGSSSQLISLVGNRVLQYLLDRNENRMIFDTPKIFFEDARINVQIGICHREDRLFFKLHREVVHDNLLKSLINHCDSRLNLETTYCTVCLIAVEVPCGFTAAAIVCLAMNMQEIILQRQNNKLEVACHVHAMVISIMSLLCWIHKATVFYAYVNKIMMLRAHRAPQLNPPIQSQYEFAVHHILWDNPELFFVDWEARYGLWKCFRLSNMYNHDILP